MVGQTKSEGASVRFAPYIEELREFFRSREVRFGSPADLTEFAARVTEGGPFQEEMGSMIRSILFREDESLSRGDLLGLLTVAVGGPAAEIAAQEMHPSIREIFMFMNAALRQRNPMFSEEIGADEEHLTAGDVLAATPAAQERAEGRTVSGRSPENGHHGRIVNPAPIADVKAEAERSGRNPEPAGSGMLFRAVTMSEADEADASMRAWEGSHSRWRMPAIVAAVLVVGIGAYLVRPLVDRVSGRPTAVGLATQTPSGSPTSAGACTGTTSAGTSRSGLAERSRWAHKLLDQRLYDAALPELKSIAQLDPGFPGVNLDESDALLHLKRPDDAREAVDTQIGISECLAKLPSPALDGYCSAEFPGPSTAACRPELSRIRQAAQLQAAMVHLELGHRVGPIEDAGTSAPVLTNDVAPGRKSAGHNEASAGGSVSPVIHERRVAPLPPASEGDTARPAPRTVASAKSSAAKAGKKAEGDDSLKKGEGTDLSLGAYSKPQ